jgi:hypothetical protein
MSAQLLPTADSSVIESPTASAGKRRRAERWLFILLTIASIGFLSVLAWPVLTRRLLIAFDLALFHLPIRAFYSRCLAAGDAFDWMPHMYGGFFLTGEGEHGPYHPLHLLLYRVLPLDVAFPLEVFLHAPLLFLGLFVFLRRYVCATAALLGALGYTFCSNSILHTIYPNYQGVMAHLPWLLWLMETASTTASAPRRRLALSAIALLTGSQLLLGSPQAVSYSLFAEALFALFLAWFRRPQWTFWVAWMGANVLGLLIGAVQLLATHALLANSTRDRFDPLAGSLSPSQLLQLIAPDLLSGHLPRYACSEPLYFGVVPFMLGLWWLSSWRNRLTSTCPVEAECEGRMTLTPNQLAGFALVLGLLSGWLALGKYGHLYYLQTCLPLVGQFRLPSRYFTLVSFAAAVLASVAFDRLLAGARTGHKASGRSLTLPWMSVGIALAVALAFRFAFPAENGRGLQRSYVAGPLFLGLAAVALTLAVRGRALGLFALAALMGVDLGVFSLTTPFWGLNIWRGQPTLAEYQAKAAIPPRSREGRWLEGAIELPHPALFNQPVLEGYRGGLEPLKRLDYHTLPALRVAHTAWQHLSRFDTPAGIPGLVRRGERWYEVPDPLPRVRLVSRMQVSENPTLDIQHIDADTTALLTHPVQMEEGEPGSADLVAERPGELRLRVVAPARRLLVLADSYDPSWQLIIDDAPATVERVNGDFLGCIVEAGEHDVRFHFRPASVRSGLLLSLSGIGLALLFALVAGVQVLTQSRRAAGGQDLARPCG